LPPADSPAACSATESSSVSLSVLSYSLASLLSVSCSCSSELMAAAGRGHAGSYCMPRGQGRTRSCAESSEGWGGRWLEPANAACVSWILAAS
jgi:hypothetical protein